jgi:cytoskeletal protein CcmA (bactofilin family)
MRMATIVWGHTSGTGDWTTAADWQGGAEPTTADIAKFSIGSSNQPTYEIDVTTAVAVDEVLVNAANAFLSESASGSITAQTLNMGKGLISLNAVNSFAHVTNAGLAEFSVDGAFGIHTIITSGVFEAMANTEMHNPFEIKGTAQFDAAAGCTVKYLGAVTATTSGPTIEFGSDAPINQGVQNATGTVELGGTSYSQPGTVSSTTIDIGSGTVLSGTGAHAVEADEMFSSALFINLDAGATLDVGHFGTNVSLRDLSGLGTLKDNSDATVITLQGATFDGNIVGGSKLTIVGGDTLGGGIGTTAITMGLGANLNLSTATGNFTISAPDDAATVTVGSHTVNHFTDFQDGHLTIDTAFDEHDLVTFKETAAYTEMVVHPGGSVAATAFYFYGLTTPGDIVLGGDANGHLQVTYDAAAAEAHAQHDAAVAAAVADAAFVPPPHDLF